LNRNIHSNWHIFALFTDVSLDCKKKGKNSLFLEKREINSTAWFFHLHYVIPKNWLIRMHVIGYFASRTILFRFAVSENDDICLQLICCIDACTMPLCNKKYRILHFHFAYAINIIIHYTYCNSGVFSFNYNSIRFDITSNRRLSKSFAHT